MSERITISLAYRADLVVRHRVEESLEQLWRGKSRIHTRIRLSNASHPSYRTILQEREVVLLGQRVKRSQLGVTVWHFSDGYVVSARILRGVGGTAGYRVLLGKIGHF